MTNIEQQELLLKVIANMEQFLRITNSIGSYATGSDLSRDGVRQRVKEWLTDLQAVQKKGS